MYLKKNVFLFVNTHKEVKFLTSLYMCTSRIEPGPTNGCSLAKIRQMVASGAWKRTDKCNY